MPKKPKKPPSRCKYPDCVNYKKNATGYCCNGCAWDHHDYKRLGLDKLEGKRSK